MAALARRSAPRVGTQRGTMANLRPRTSACKTRARIADMINGLLPLLGSRSVAAALVIALVAFACDFYTTPAILTPLPAASPFLRSFSEPSSAKMLEHHPQPNLQSSFLPLTSCWNLRLLMLNKLSLAVFDLPYFGLRAPSTPPHDQSAMRAVLACLLHLAPSLFLALCPFAGIWWLLCLPMRIRTSMVLHVMLVVRIPISAIAIVGANAV